MVDWYLNRALSNFRKRVDELWPNRGKGSDGTIGDRAHQRTPSDHNPDPDGSVDAWDMTVSGVDVWRCIAEFEKHESSSYWIYNDQIALRSEGWRRRSYAYAGPNRNRHTKHVHFNTRQSHERSTKPWFVIKEKNVELTEKDIQRIVSAVVPEVVKQVWGVVLANPVRPNGSSAKSLLGYADKRQEDTVAVMNSHFRDVKASLAALKNSVEQGLEPGIEIDYREFVVAFIDELAGREQDNA